MEVGVGVGAAEVINAARPAEKAAAV
jgi:hypothetical protein